MNILLIGNGFDLAHHLPTTYMDFLKFTKVIKKIKEDFDKYKSIIQDDIEWYGIDEKLHAIIVKNFDKVDKISEVIKDNIWIDYFLQCDMHGEENWIDFESEISEVIQSIDTNMKDTSLYSKVFNLNNQFMRKSFIDEDNEKHRITYKQLTNRLLNDLDRLILSLEMYLADFVEQIQIDSLIKDIEGIIPNIDKIISFNYTHTYVNYQNRKKDIEVDFLHGEAKTDDTIDYNNMVLGIDEYLSEYDQKNRVEFIGFKKFYQRIYKKTGCKYREWIDKMDELRKIFKNDKHGNHLYVFGHSLDVTDGDVLSELILNKNIDDTTIFYRNREQLGEEITNLVKVIGEPNLIDRTAGKKQNILFKKQS